MATSPFVLASGSPRRRQLLESAGYMFEVVAPEIEETLREGESPMRATCRLAVRKAEAVVRRRQGNEVVLAADTSVICGERMFGKPESIQDACRQLAALAGRNHRVVTAWVVSRCGRGAAPGEPHYALGYTSTIVRMRDLGRAEIRAYVERGESADKAGAYAVQGTGRALIGALLGPLDNVVGLPLGRLGGVLARFGVHPC